MPNDLIYRASVIGLGLIAAVSFVALAIVAFAFITVPPSV